MEKKSKYRILGVLIVSSLVVVALPFFQSEKNLPTEITVVKAPPFPESTTFSDKDNFEINTNQFASNFTDSKPTPVVPVSDLNQAPANPVTPADNNLISSADSSSPSSNVTSKEKGNSLNKNKIESENIAEKITDTLNTSPILKTTATTKKNKQALIATHEKSKKIPTNKLSNKLPTIENNGLSHFKDSVWVIQLGSFKNKSDALRLTNRLRSNGYKAFIQQISTSFGNSTRVFVGPEYQQDSAFALADRLAHHLHIRGVVLSYKPLTL